MGPCALMLVDASGLIAGRHVTPSSPATNVVGTCAHAAHVAALTITSLRLPATEVAVLEFVAMQLTVWNA